MTTSQGKKRSYVALIEDELSSNKLENTVVVGNCVTAKAVRRSGLLSGIKTTEGLASLPGNISPQDISLWQAASVVDIEFHPDELVVVLKVADALGDKDDGAWVETLAGMAATTVWGDSSRADTMLAALLRLPPHLLHRVFLVYLADRCMYSAINTLPPPLHATIIAAAANGGTLAIDTVQAQVVLMQLPTVRMPAPGLSTLELGPVADVDDEPYSDEDDDPDVDEHPYPAASGALLARAASAHPSLTSLVLTGPRFRPQWLRNFAACLPPAALPRLVDLRIAVDAHPCGCVELATALALLPTLTTLSITIVINRRASSAQLSLHSYARLAAAPASLPALQTLQIEERPAATVDWLAFFRDGTRASVARTLLPLLSAPSLTSLHFHPSTSKFSVRALLAEVTRARFPALRRLAFNGVLPSDKSPGSGDAGGAARAAGSAFPPLQQVAVGSVCPQSAVRIAADCAHVSAATLTSLTVALADDEGLVSEFVGHACTCESVRRAWNEFMRVLGTCKQLHSLNLSCLCGTSLEARGVYSAELTNALLELTELTHLTLQAGRDDVTGEDRTWLDARVLGRGIAGLKALECLCVNDGEGTLVFDHHEALLGACVGLERLSHLELLCDVCEVNHIINTIPKLRALKELRLPETLFPDGRDSRACLAFGDLLCGDFALDLDIV